MQLKRFFLRNSNKLLVSLLASFGVFQACQKADPYTPEIVPMYGIVVESHAGVSDSIQKADVTTESVDEITK